MGSWLQDAIDRVLRLHRWDDSKDTFATREGYETIEEDGR